MSLLSPSVRIALTPSRVAMAGHKTYLESAVASPGWTGAIKALEGLLAESGLKGRASVILSHHFAHVHLLPSPPVFLKPAEMQGWIRDYLAKQFGESGQNWQMVWQPERPGKPFLVSGIASLAMTELVEAIRSSGFKPAQFQPWLAVSWNRMRRQSGKEKGWYALAEPGRLTLAGLAKRGIWSLRSIQIQDDPVPALSDLIKRETLLAGDQEASTPLWIESVLLRSNWRSLGGGLSVHPLSSGSESLAAMLGT